MANKGPRGNTSGEFPETESFVPGARKRIGTIRGNDLFMKRSAKISAETNWKFKWVETHTVRDNMGVTVKASLGVSIRHIVASQIPDYERLVATAREQHIWADCLSEFMI